MQESLDFMKNLDYLKILDRDQMAIGSVKSGKLLLRLLYRWHVLTIPHEVSKQDEHFGSYRF
jgi:hypothetical protein